MDKFYLLEKWQNSICKQKNSFLQNDKKIFIDLGFYWDYKGTVWLKAWSQYFWKLKKKGKPKQFEGFGIFKITYYFFGKATVTHPNSHHPQSLKAFHPKTSYLKPSGSTYSSDKVFERNLWGLSSKRMADEFQRW